MILQPGGTNNPLGEPKSTACVSPTDFFPPPGSGVAAPEGSEDNFVNQNRLHSLFYAVLRQTSALGVAGRAFSDPFFWLVRLERGPIP
jgi:hypothetical protein